LYDTRRDEILECYFDLLEHEVQDAREAFLMPGIPLIVQRLKKIPDCRVGIVTGNYKRAARIKMAKFGIDPLFPVGGYADDSPMRFRIILAAIEKAEAKFKLRFAKSNIFMIGDTPHDAAAAKQTGVTGVGVTTGRFTEDELIHSGCDYVFKNLGDVTHVLKTFGISCNSNPTN
jgi:phosphoglycolate phosphatase-like HAD superfamily hydrolase